MAKSSHERIIGLFAEHGDESVRSVLPWFLMLLAEGLPAEEIPPDALERIGEFGERAGLRQDMSPEEAQSCLGAYATAHPPDPVLMSRLVEVMQQSRPSADDLRAATASVLGHAASRGVLGRTAPAPNGAVAAGPMARFAAQALDTNRKNSGQTGPEPTGGNDES